MRHVKVNKILCSFLICSMILSSGTVIFANNDGELLDTMKSATLVRKEPAPAIYHMHTSMKDVVEQLVKEGRLSREKAAQIDKYLQQIKEDQGIQKGHKHGLIDELVQAKIINNTEADAIRNKFREIRQKKFDDKLNALVQKGTITQTQADKVKVYFEADRKEKAEQHKNLQNMTEEQRKVFFKEHREDDPMTKLEQDGVLTREQVEEMRRIFLEIRKNRDRER